MARPLLTFASSSWHVLRLFIIITTSKAAKAAALVPDPLVHFSVGAVAGGIGAMAAYPFDYIKSQMQTELGSSKYENGWDAFCFTVKENPLHLYRGVGVQVLGIAPEKGIKLGVNDVLQSTFMSSMGDFPLWAQVASGATAGACQVIVSSPLEVLKVGLQTSDMTFREVWDEVGGVRGLFRGAGVCIARDVLWTAVCFPLYAAWTSGESSMNPFIAGALSGAFASGVATPPDVIKTRILSQDESSRRISTSQSNPVTVACRIIKSEGFKGLFSGVNERCLGAIPRFGTTLAMHDFLESCLSNTGMLSNLS